MKNITLIITTVFFIVLFFIGITIHQSRIYRPSFDPQTIAQENKPEIIPSDFNCHVDYYSRTSINKIKKNNVDAYKNYIKIDEPDINIGSLIDSKSMIPLVNYPNLYLYKDYAEQELAIGDIIVYKKNQTSNIIHSICNIKEDEKGVYYVTKGYNNAKSDSVKVRKDMIKEIVVGVLYT